jgi:uncharacterized protein YqkB
MQKISLKDTSILVLNEIYTDDRITTKQYNKIDALLELKRTTEYLLMCEIGKTNG